MTTPAAPSTPSRRIPGWLIALIAVGGLGALGFCAIVVIGILTLLGARVTPAPLVAVDGQSQLSVPGAWRSVTDLHQEAQLQASNERQEQYVMVFTTAKTTLEGMALAEYAEFVVADVEAALGAPEVSAPRTLTLDGRPAIQYQIAGELDDLDIVYLTTFVDGTHNYYEIFAWTLASQAQQNLPVLEEVSASFQEIIVPGAGQAVYDAAADPAADIDAALAQARAAGKRVLIDFGADWCPDCIVLDRHLDDPEVRAFLDEHFVMVRVYVGRWDANLEIAERYGNPIEMGIPAVVVLDADEKIVAHTGGGELATARTASKEDILALLQQWAAQ
jgi:thiol-disulfide isomerase/thioredoxin